MEKYLRDGPVRTPDPKQRWLTFVHNHARVIVACDFFVVTASFRTLYVFVIMELAGYVAAIAALACFHTKPRSVAASTFVVAWDMSV